MRKSYTVLCLAVILSCMAACGKNDTQAQASSRQAEPSTIERSSQPASLNGSKNADESENVAESAEAASQAGSVQETERNKTDTAETDIQDNMEENKVENMNVQVGDVVFSATLEENEAVSALVEMMRESPVVIQMSDYSGFEKVGSLGIRLPASNSQTTTQAGDIVLYNGNQIVIFYGSNSWSYTRLGHIDDLTGWEDALGSGNVTVTFSLG